MMRMIDRVRHRQAVRPSTVLIPTLAMFAVGIAGMAMMRAWC
jgi:hypothetical protein